MAGQVTESGWRGVLGHGWRIGAGGGKAGIESKRKRHAGRRGAGLLTGNDHLTLQVWRLVAPGAPRWSALHGVHLSAWWTLPSRVNRAGSGCLYRTLHFSRSL